MARNLRVGYCGRVYHVMNRGDRREAFFQEDADRQRFWKHQMHEEATVQCVRKIRIVRD